jgi:hypothetical protein
VGLCWHASRRQQHASSGSGRLHTADKLLPAVDHANNAKLPAAGDVELQAPSHPVLDEGQGSGSSGLHLAPAADRLGSAANPPAVPDEAPGNVPGRQSADGNAHAAEAGGGGTGSPGAAATAAPVELAGGSRAPATDAPSGASPPADPRADSGASLRLPPPWRTRRKPFRTASLASQPSADEALSHQHSGGLLTPSGMAGDLRRAALAVWQCTQNRLFVTLRIYQRAQAGNEQHCDTASLTRTCKAAV